MEKSSAQARSMSRIRAAGSCSFHAATNAATLARTRAWLMRRRARFAGASRGRRQLSDDLADLPVHGAGEVRPDVLGEPRPRDPARDLVERFARRIKGDHDRDGVADADELRVEEIGVLTSHAREEVLHLAED